MNNPHDVPARVCKRSLTIDGHRTSISLEEPFWVTLKDLAHARNLSLAALVSEIDQERRGVGLSSAIRVHVLRHALQGQTAKVLRHSA